jgi:hypothetical protein
MIRESPKASEDRPLYKRGKADTGNCADPGTQAVHVVNEIKGIGNAHDPEQGGHGIQGKGVKPVQAKAEKSDQGSGQNLADEFAVWFDIAKVVKQSQQEQKSGADKNGGCQ